MKKKADKRTRDADADTMRPEYDFSGGVRGVTAARFREGSNLVLIDAELLDVFPDAESVNEALHALATVIRGRLGKESA